MRSYSEDQRAGTYESAFRPRKDREPTPAERTTEKVDEEELAWGLQIPEALPEPVWERDAAGRAGGMLAAIILAIVGKILVFALIGVIAVIAVVIWAIKKIL